MYGLSDDDLRIQARARTFADELIPYEVEAELNDGYLPKELVGDGTLFRLRVRGDSMINAAIADGDIVVVRQQSQAENGDIVAAMIDGETTVRPSSE